MSYVWFVLMVPASYGILKNCTFVWEVPSIGHLQGFWYHKLVLFHENNISSRTNEHRFLCHFYLKTTFFQNSYKNHTFVWQVLGFYDIKLTLFRQNNESLSTSEHSYTINLVSSQHSFVKVTKFQRMAALFVQNC